MSKARGNGEQVKVATWAALLVVVAACARGDDPAPGSPDSGVVASQGRDTLSSCFVAGRSVLGREPGSVAPGPAAVRGWMLLRDFRTSDSSTARLIDEDGFALDAGWNRYAGDSGLVVGFNDFVRIELRLAFHDSGAIGSLEAHSDAALERGPSGKLQEFRRFHPMQFKAVACDSMPAPAGNAAIDVLPQGTPRPGIRFEAPDVRRGQQVGTLTLDSIAWRRVMADSVIVGMARFTGEIELDGWTLRNPDADPGRVITCFEADSASTARLPRWSDDERRAWFCFSNRMAAARALGPPSEGVPASIVVDSFTIHRGLSDEVNSAWFVRLVRRGARGPA